MKELVKVENGDVFTTSKIIADQFGKEHKRVLQDIRDLECSDEFREHGCVLSSYTSPQSKSLPMYNISRDGFSFLAMGYTGPKAAKFKEAFIGAFNAMEATLNSPDLIIARALKLVDSKLKEVEARNKRLVHNNRTYSTAELAKELDMRSAQVLNKELCNRGIQFKNRKGTWLLYAEYADKGFNSIKQSEINGCVVYHREWTGLGREWLIGLLNERGYNELFYK